MGSSDRPISRRDLLKWASAGAGAVGVGGATYFLGREDAPSSPTSRFSTGTESSEFERRPEVTAAPPPEALPSPVSSTADLSQRVLVVVEMGGGNDGMSMVVPYGMGSYYDLRPRTAIAESDVLALDGEVGFHSALKRVHGRGAAVIQGVGTPEPDGSHFEMLARWWNGSTTSGNRFDTGFLGRLADSMGDPASAAVALSIGTGTHPMLVSAKVPTLSIPGANAAGYVYGANDDDPFRQAFQAGFLAFAQPSGWGGVDERIRGLKQQSVSFASTLGVLDEENNYPGSNLGQGLRLAAQLFANGSGVRIVHVPMNADFDTHDDHNGRYGGLMDDFDTSVAAFFEDLDARGLSDRVLLMTTSEFGRTAHDNDSYGLDHGTASNMLLMGPVNPGRFGEHPSLDTLDDNGDLIATMGFDQYYATVAEGWFGVPASDVLDGNVTPLDGVFA
jgi:uncharacterized protein (DUF1501 family)